jgi:hypothetical protein
MTAPWEIARTPSLNQVSLVVVERSHELFLNPEYEEMFFQGSESASREQEGVKLS